MGSHCCETIMRKLQPFSNVVTNVGWREFYDRLFNRTLWYGAGNLFWLWFAAVLVHIYV